MIVKINRQIFNDNNFRSQAWKKFFWTSNILGSTYVLLKLLVYLSLKNSWYRTKKKKCWLIQRIFFNIWHPKILMSEIIAKIGKHYYYQIFFFIVTFISINDRCGQNYFVGQRENNYLCMYIVKGLRCSTSELLFAVGSWITWFMSSWVKSNFFQSEWSGLKK